MLVFNLLDLPFCFIFIFHLSVFLSYLLEVSLNLLFMLNFYFDSYVSFLCLGDFSKDFFFPYTQYHPYSFQGDSLTLSLISPSSFFHLFVLFSVFQVRSFPTCLEVLSYCLSLGSLESSLQINQTWDLGLQSNRTEVHISSL